MTYSAKQERFDRWVENLEQRLAWHLFCYRAPEPILTRLIEVVEESGEWDVYLNGKKMFHFTGSDAYQRATRAAGDLANS